MFCFFFLDRKNHQNGYDQFGFSVISHVDNDFIQKKIPNYVTKNKDYIEVTLKAGQCSISRDKLAEKSKKYFKEQLKGIIDKDVYSIPYVDDKSMHPDLETTYITIMKTLKKWCSGNKQNEEEMNGIVIYDYNLDNHLKFLKFPISSSSSFLQCEKLHKESNKLIIAYNPEKKLIFLIRSANIESLKCEMERSTIDVMKFILLHFEILKSSGIRVMNLLVTKKEFNDLPLCCESCKQQVISMEQVSSSVDFQNWLTNKNEKFSVSVNCENTNKNFNQDFCAQLLFFLATHGRQTENHFVGMLPSKTDLLREQVEEATFLTNAHWQIIHSDRMQQIVFGWYDSGVLAVAQKRAELISRKLSSNEILYFICCDSKSQLLTDQKKKSGMKLIWNSNLRNLWDIIKEILEENETKQKIHLVAVEYDLEELNDDRLAELDEMLKKNDKLKDSYIFLACQPIQKKRILENREKKSEIVESNLYKKLKIWEEKLYYNQANTSGINKLIASMADELVNREFCTVCRILFNTEPKAKTENHDERKGITFDEKLERYKRNNSIDLDGKSSDAVTVTSYFNYFIKPDYSKLNKELVKPSLVEIKYTEQNEDFMILNLKTTLYQIIHRCYREQKDYDNLKSCKQEKHVILHFDTENDFPQYIKIAFQLMGEEERVTNKYKDFINYEDKTILICNYRTFRGLTNSSVIVILDPFVYHQQFYVLESLSRASVVLDIIVLNIKNKETLQSTIIKWKDPNKIQSLFSPFKSIPYEENNGVEGNTSEEGSSSEDIENLKFFFDKSKSTVSYDKTDFSFHSAR